MKQAPYLYLWIMYSFLQFRALTDNLPNVCSCRNERKWGKGWQLHTMSRRHYVTQSLQRDENRYYFVFPKYKTSAHTLKSPKLLKWFEQYCNEGQWIPQSFTNLQRKCRRPWQQLQIVNLQASSSTQTALIVLTTAGRSMHYLALSHILLRHICVATAWEQLLGFFCSCCFHNTAAFDNSMSANCGTSCPRYKRPTSYLCGIPQFISTRIASSQLKSNVLSHPEFCNSHVENVLWIWHRALHCEYSRRNPKKLVKKGRGYWPAQAGRGTAGEGWQQNNKCWSHHQLGPNNRLCGDHVVDPQHYSYSYSYSTAAIDRR